MDRRHFLASSSIGLGALGLAPGAALADAATRASFHAALKRDSRLAVYADTQGELAGAATVRGRLPADLDGVFFRNGPGRFELGGERYHHWFDGDGMAQRWQIGGGKVSHCGSFVRTQKFTEESKAGRFLYSTYGTKIDRSPMKSNDTLNAANTNLLPFNGRLYALWEGGSATELDPATLATIGLKTWRDDLKSMPFSAHPKRDPDGSLWNFGALPGTDTLALYHIGAAGAVLAAGMVNIADLTMVHDFAVSAKHLIFLVPPYTFRNDASKSFLDQHVWVGSGAGARPMRVVVVDKATLTLRRVFELPPRMVFHFGNAFDDGATTRFDAVLHEGDVLGELGGIMRGERAPVPGRSSATQITLDYAAGTAREARLFGASEFPGVMPQVATRRHRRLALLSAGGAGGNGGRILNTVNLVDTDSGKADSYRFDAGWQVEEHVLVPRRNARSETDGYLVGVAQDSGRLQTVLTVFDAAHVKDGPVALARLPYRAPHCFHGNFLPS
ncbi:carotenoid oxygenase family protein [Massilia glaciei]|uniref:Apocarotenoid-15,15'-oxygenase n=1 Tax=Massilia glaciei TaxID=1524097 RepID=A0A2U2HM89_9BURK|nr:carotenoid oxygenase family protein [Massilia glaciei]PWF48545.1 apocarotenoid-15,15'-oxygenase [Massilia glaciei]